MYIYIYIYIHIIIYAWICWFDIHITFNYIDCFSMINTYWMLFVFCALRRVPNMVKILCIWLVNFSIKQSANKSVVFSPFSANVSKTHTHNIFCMALLTTPLVTDLLHVQSSTKAVYAGKIVASSLIHWPWDQWPVCLKRLHDRHESGEYQLWKGQCGLFLDDQVEQLAWINGLQM